MTPGTFAQGNEFLTPTSGVGPFIPNAAEKKDPFDSFLTTYDTVNTWRRQKEADNMAKQKYIKDNLADLDFTTEGILPSQKAKEYLQRGKEHMMEELTSYGVAGQDPFSPASREAYATASGLKKAYEVDVNILKEANDARVALHAANTKNPDSFNPQEIVDWDRELMNAEVTEIPKILAKIPKPMVSTLPQLLQKEVEKGKPSQESYIGEDGMIIEEKKLGTDDEYWLSKFNSPEYKNATMQELAPVMDALEMPLPDPSSPDYAEVKATKQAALGRKEAVDNFMQTYNQNHPDSQIDFPEAWYLLEARQYGYKQRTFKGQDAYYKAAAKSWGVGEEEAKKYGDNFWQLANLLNGSDDFYEETIDVNGRKVQRSNTFINQPAGTFDKVEVDASGNAKTVKVPNTIIDIQRIEDLNGDVVFKYKTEQLRDDPQKYGADANGYRTTKDPNEVVTLISAISNTTQGGANSGKFSRMFYDWTKSPDGKQGFWDDSKKAISLKKLRQIIPVTKKPPQQMPMMQYAAQEPKTSESKYAAEQEAGIQAVMETNGIDRQTAIDALIKAGKLK